MANQIPLANSPDAAGGYLVPQELKDVLLEKVNRLAPTLGLSRVERINSNRAAWPIYKGRPVAGFVAEGADKPVDGAEFSELTVLIKKMALFVVYTEEVLEDARIDPQVLINSDVEEGFADLIDKNLLGTHPGGGSTQAYFNTGFDATASAAAKALQNSSIEVELGTGPDAFALAMSSAMQQIEANGYNPNGMVVAFDAKQTLRDARYTDGRPVYSTDPLGNPASLGGMNLAYSTNLDGFPAGLQGGAGSPEKTVAIIGDFSNSIAVMRRDLSTKVFDQAVLGAHNLALQNKLAVRWEMRMGYTIFDRDRSFARIINAS
jgi:HK97 family phage major capsid protein